MKAKVKRIKIGTVLDADGHRDSFIDSMRSNKILEFVPYPQCKNWWIGTTENGWEYNYHTSWLKDIQE